MSLGKVFAGLKLFFVVPFCGPDVLIFWAPVSHLPKTRFRTMWSALPPLGGRGEKVVFGLQERDTPPAKGVDAHGRTVTGYRWFVFVKSPRRCSGHSNPGCSVRKNRFIVLSLCRLARSKHFFFCLRVRRPCTLHEEWPALFDGTLWTGGLPVRGGCTATLLECKTNRRYFCFADGPSEHLFRAFCWFHHRQIAVAAFDDRSLLLGLVLELVCQMSTALACQGGKQKMTAIVGR